MRKVKADEGVVPSPFQLCFPACFTPRQVCMEGEAEAESLLKPGSFLLPNADHSGKFSI